MSARMSAGHVPTGGYRAGRGVRVAMNAGSRINAVDL